MAPSDASDESEASVPDDPKAHDAAAADAEPAGGECRTDADCTGKLVCTGAGKCTPPVLAAVEVTPNPSKDREPVRVACFLSNPTDKTQTVEVQLLLPQGINGVSEANRSPGASCPGCGSGRTATWTIEELEPGETEVLWVRAQPSNATDGSELSFTVDVHTANGYQTMATASTVVHSTRALSLLVDPSANPVAPGAPLTYALRYSNESPDPIDAVQLTLELPESATHESGKRILTFDLGRLPPGTGGTIEVPVKVATGLAKGSLVRATGSLRRASASEREAQVVAHVAIASESPVMAAIEVNPDPVVDRGLLMVALTVTNPGTSVRTVDAILHLPAGINGVNAVNYSSGANCNPCASAGLMRHRIDDLGPGQSEVIWIRPQVYNGKNGQLLQFWAELRTVDAPPSWRSGTARVDSTRALNLVLDSSGLTTANHELQYRLHYSNQGADPLDPVQLVFRLPERTTHSSGKRELLFELGRLTAGAGGTQEITLLVEDSLPAGAQLRAAAELRVTGPLHRSTRAVDDTAVSEGPLQAVIEVSPAAVADRALQMVNITVSNPGSSTRTAEVTALLPNGINGVNQSNYSSGGGCPATCNGGRVLRWTIADLAPGQSENLWFRPSPIGVPNGTLLQYVTQVQTVGAPPLWTGDTGRVLTP